MERICGFVAAVSKSQEREAVLLVEVCATKRVEKILRKEVYDVRNQLKKFSSKVKKILEKFEEVDIKALEEW